MTSLKEKRVINTSLHAALHKNLYLLSLSYPMNKDLLAVFKEGVFEKPNRVAFHQISYYLMSIIDSKSVASSPSWALLEIQSEVEYRKQFIKFVDHAIKTHNGYISPIVPSWLVNAGGIKVTKLIFELTQLALMVHITEKAHRTVQFNVQTSHLTDFLPNTAFLKEEFHKAFKWWQMYLQNMEAIAKIYKNYLPKLTKKKDDATSLLNSVIENIKLKTDTSHHKMVDQLGNIFVDTDLTKEWSLNLEKELIQIENRWLTSSSSVVSLARKCKIKSANVIERYSKKTSNDSKLIFDSKKDLFRVSPSFESELSSRQSSVIRSTVRNGVLDFPNMLRSYAVVMSHIFKTYNPPVICDYVVDLESKKNAVLFIKEHSKDLLTELYQFHNQLKSGMPRTADAISDQNSNFSLWIDKARQVPSIPKMLIPYESASSDSWNEFLKNITFKRYSYPSLRESENNDRRQHFVEQTAKKPEYLKSIEEIQNNMSKITGSVNSRTTFMMSNATMKSFSCASEIKPNRFSTNHIQRLLTTAKKNPGVSIHNNHNLQKKFGNLFKVSPESSFTLQRTQSSPGFVVEKKTSIMDSSVCNRKAYIKSTERISGVEEIEYTCFLSGLGSLPNLTVTIGSNEDISNQKSVENSIQITSEINDSHVKKNRKSLENIIERFERIKMSAKLDKVLSEKKQTGGKERNGSDVDSFLDKLDLNQKGVEKTPEILDNLSLSNVPDLLSPSLNGRSVAVVWELELPDVSPISTMRFFSVKYDDDLDENCDISVCGSRSRKASLQHHQPAV